MNTNTANQVKYRKSVSTREPVKAKIPATSTHIFMLACLNLRVHGQRPLQFGRCYQAATLAAERLLQTRVQTFS